MTLEGLKEKILDFYENASVEMLLKKNKAIAHHILKRVEEEQITKAQWQRVNKQQKKSHHDVNGGKE